MIDTLDVSGADSPASHPSLDALLQVARDMIPTLRERSRACEEARMILPETVADFRDAGFLRVAKSKRFGGWQMGIGALVDLSFEIGRGCGSSAWMAGQWPGHNFMVGYLSLEAQEEYWSNGPDTISSTASSVARIDVQPEGGGLRVRDTQLRFSSGCDYAEWILMMGKHGLGLVPREDFVVLDDWYPSGLRGTGSKSIVIKDAFIPPHRIVTMEQMSTGTTPGAKLTDDPYLRGAMNIVLNQLLCAALLGAARGVQDLFEERAMARIDLHTRKPASESPGAQLRFGESHAEVEAAHMFLKRNCAMLEEWGHRDYRPNIQERAAMRRDVTYAAKLGVQATNRLMAQGDASGMFDTASLGRLSRDVYMAGLQANLTWDEPAMSFARSRWNVEPLSLMT